MHCKYFFLFEWFHYYWNTLQIQFYLRKRIEVVKNKRTTTNWVQSFSSSISRFIEIEFYFTIEFDFEIHWAWVFLNSLKNHSILIQFLESACLHIEYSICQKCSKKWNLCLSVQFKQLMCLLQQSYWRQNVCTRLNIFRSTFESNIQSQRSGRMAQTLPWIKSLCYFSVAKNDTESTVWVFIRI